jgi:repressor of nif and glnA expression
MVSCQKLEIKKLSGLVKMEDGNPGRNVEIYIGAESKKNPVQSFMSKKSATIYRGILTL